MTVELALAVGASAICGLIALAILRGLVLAGATTPNRIRGRARRLRYVLAVILGGLLWFCLITLIACIVVLATIGLGHLWADAFGKDNPQ